MALFLDLFEIADNKESISLKCEKGKWRSMEYRTKLGQGQLLVAAESVKPQPVALNLNLKGWHKIYISMFDMRYDNYCYVKLTDDADYTPVRQSRKGNPRDWCTTEYMEEIYWKCADLTDQQFVLAKPDPMLGSCSGLAWIRCEEMTEEEVSQYLAAQNREHKCVQMHFDIDSFFEDRSEEKKEHFIKLRRLLNTNMDFCTLEYSMTYDHAEKEEGYMPLRNNDHGMCTGKYTYDEIYEKYVDFAHENGLKLYATDRMSMANFYTPYCKPEWRNHFITENTQYYCKNRDGSTLNVCSYAYEEVQEYALGNILRMVKKGFDGVSMIMHRGIHIQFEQPVLERFAKLYPEVDPKLLPITDQRLHSVWCEFMNEFMRKVRKALDETFERHIPINVIVDYSLATSKHLGLDVATWAKEGLIDSVSQADMETYEDLTGCMSDQDPGLIDLEKYRMKIEDEQIIKRHYGTDVELVCKHIAEYRKLEEDYGIVVYHVLPWVHTIEPEQYMDAVEQMKACGAERFLAWNTNHVTWDLPEFHLITSIGNASETEGKLRQFYRVLSLDHSDISHYNPNWRG